MRRWFLVWLLLSATASAQVGIGTNVATNRDANGYTIFNPQTGSGSCTSPSKGSGTYTGSCIIYLADAGHGGNDANNCVAPPPVDPNFATPCLTIAQGVTYLRNNSSDWLLFQKGNTWTDQWFGIFTKHGSSPASPMMFGAYGTGARPLLNAVSAPAGVGILQCQGANTNCDNLVIYGLEWYSYQRDPGNVSFNPAGIAASTGFIIETSPRFFWIEDCKLSFYVVNAIENLSNPFVPSGTVAIRNSIIYDNYDTDGTFSQGLFVEYISSFLADNNYFIHNGWTTTGFGSPKTIFKHNLYVSAEVKPSQAPGVVVSNNVNVQASAQAYRGPTTGGVVFNNLSVQNPIVGFVSFQPHSVIDSTVNLEGVDIDASTPRGQGWTVQEFADFTSVTNNLFTQLISTGAATHYAIDICGVACGVGPAINGAIVSGNIACDWGNVLNAQFLDNGTNTDTSGGNYFVNTNCLGNGYPDPTRSVERYDSEVLGGPGTLADLITRWLAQSKDNFDGRLRACAINDWIRAGFGMTQKGCS